MCKILAFTDAKKLNLKKSINAIGNTLLKLERDGFGYAIQGEHGVYGEKCVAKSFSTRFFTKYAVNLPIVKPAYERFGTLGLVTGPGIFHGRTSTNVRGLTNCHPMQRNDANGAGWHLIHNGVVEDNGPEYVKGTENDSEDVLERLMLGHAETPDKPMSQVEAHLEGYYAFAAIDPQGRLHVCRDGIASLYMAWSATYETYVFGTTESLLRSINKTLKAKLGPIDEVSDEVYMIFQGNELVYQIEIKPLGYTTKQSVYADQSLGRSLGGEVYSGSTFNGPRYEKNGQVFDSKTGTLLDWAHHRRVEDKDRHLSETEWSKLAETIPNDAYDDGSDDDKETAYYKYRAELDRMDASYTLFNEHMKPIDLAMFKKMDHISQELCTVLRGDGTVVDVESFETGRERLG